jgi:hypothetical protein
MEKLGPRNKRQTAEERCARQVIGLAASLVILIAGGVMVYQMIVASIPGSSRLSANTMGGHA